MSYQTSQIAKIIGVHPNTVRFYEEIEFISPVPRRANGYRVFSSLHLEQLKLVRIALSTQLLSNNLRKEVIEIIKSTARNEIEYAISLAHDHKSHVLEEKCRAEEAIALVESIIGGKEKLEIDCPTFGRKDTSLSLGVTKEVLRNWERNGLITVPRNSAGYRRYGRKELGRLKIIYILRQANFSMVSILRMLQELDKGNMDVRSSIDTPNAGEDIIRATDRYLYTLSEEEITVQKIIDQLMVISSQNY
jgi:DNA-binding transcriptional MerR regulator